MSKSVLIINESDKYRNQLAQAIEKAGHTVIACGNGKDGVSIFLKEHPAVVILDISISVMNGIDFLKKVEIRPGASFIVIILTDFQNEENIRFCSNLGGRNYLRKDHHPKELLTMINLAGEATESKNRISLAEQEVLTKQKELIETQKGFSRVGKILENGHFFYAYKTDHGFIDVGSTVENVLGYTESEFQNDYLTYLTGNEINAQYEQFRASALKGKEQVYELEFIHRNGLKKTLRFYDYPTKDASDGNFVVEGFAADITDQVKIKRDMNILNKKLEEIYDKHGLELSKVKIKYDELLKTVNDWVCETDENSLIISSNSAGSSILGYHEKELAGKSLLEFLHETDKKILNSELKNAVDNSDVTRLDVNFITKSGELKPMMMSILTNGHNGDSRSAFKFIVHDQTHEHLSKKLSAQNHLLFSEFKDAAFTFDSNGIIESYHSSQPQTLGISGDKLIGTEIWNLPFLKNHYNLTHDVLDQVLRDQEKFTTKINTTARGENHVFHTVLAPYLDAKILMTLEEVTDWENLESELNLQKSIGSILLESVANMASYLIDKEGTIREVSKIALQNTGAGLDELLGGNLYGFIDKKDVANLKKLVADACESGEKKMFESEKDEQIISYSVIPVLENEKYLSSLVVTVDDSTQISQALRNYDWEKSVRETALAKLAEAILFVDPIGQVKFVSESLSRLTGFECQSLVGTEAPFPFWGKIHRKELHSEFKDVVLSAHPEDRISKCVLTTVEGEEIKATQTYSRILDGAGKYLGTLILIKDRMETTRLESSLEEIMEQVKFLTGSFTDPVFRLSGTGKILNISASFQHLTGYEPKDIEGKPLMDFLSSGDRTTYLKILKELFLNKKLLSFRINLKKKDGGFIPVLINVMMIRNNGKTTASGTIRDISEQIDLEHKLTSYTCAMENLESHVPLGVIHLDMQSKIEMANAEFCRLLGLEMSSVSGKSITELIKTKPSGKWYQSGSSPTQVFVQDWQKQDGKIVKTEVTLFDMASDSSPNQKGRLAVIRDLTDEELLKSELNSTRNRNNILFNHSRDGIFLLDGQTIKECNAAALDLFNAPQNKVIGRTLSKFSINEGKNGTGKPTLLTHKIEKAFGGENLDFEWKFIGSGGSERICEVKLNRVEMDGKFYLNCIIRDQSELVELKEDVHNYREKMGKIIETESSDLQNEIHQLRKHTKRYETGPLSILDWDYRLGDGIKIVYASESLRQYGLTP
ncbi:MAG: PAS domain S-box protein, partial [FCB group bacterium]|nr:PAS domain S-box protein [FCB group bacterium]